MAEAAESAGAQGRFWDMHELLFENQHALDIEAFLAHALGLDLDRFTEDLDAHRFLQRARRDFIEEEREGMYRAERSYGRFRRVIPLPEGVDADGAEAHFDHGVLAVSIRTPEAQQRGKRIEIQEGKPLKPSNIH